MIMSKEKVICTFCLERTFELVILIGTLMRYQGQDDFVNGGVAKSLSGCA